MKSSPYAQRNLGLLSLGDSARSGFKNVYIFEKSCLNSLTASKLSSIEQIE